MENIASQAFSFSKTAFDPLEFIGKSDNLSHCSSKNFTCPSGNAIHQPGHKIHQSLAIRHNFLCTLYMHYLKTLCPSNQGNRVKFVYVIRLHAVQFGNNWMKKFHGQPNWRRPLRLWAYLRYKFISVIKHFPCQIAQTRNHNKTGICCH